MILAFQNKDGGIYLISGSLNSRVKYINQGQTSSSTGLTGFKGKLLPSYKLRNGMLLNKKGISKDFFFFDWEIMCDFVSENDRLKAKPGHFIDIGYKSNFAKNPEKEDWLGFSVGYLVNKKSNIFDENTWRFSTYRNLGKNIEIVSQLYFTENFSKAFPGIGLHLGF